MPFFEEKDISTEKYREYHYKDFVYKIEGPKTLWLKQGGSGHRIVDVKGITHYCPTNVPHCIKWFAPDEPVSF